MLPPWKSKQCSSRVRPSIIPFILVLVFVTQLTITESFAQQADFTVDVNTPSTGCLPLTVKFNDSSTGGVTSWAWDFGDGASSTNQNALNTYTAAGVYTVSLKVFKGSLSDTETKTGLVVVHGFPAPNFSIPPSQTSGCAPLGVTFTDQTDAQAGAIAERLWVFGDGGTSTSINPSYIYDQPGDMYVSLTVKNVHGCERTKVIATPIHVLGPTPDFSVNHAAICTLPANFEFTDQSTGTAPLSYSWNFGDNTPPSTAGNPQHSYTNAGAYTVVETVTDGNGCKSKHSMIVNAGYQSGLSFQPSKMRVCPSTELTFDVQATSPITSYDWSFENNGSSTEPDPVISYDTPGNYTITLIAKLNANTCFSIDKKTVQVLAPPNPTFTHTVDCDFNVTLKNTTLGAERVEWYNEGIFLSDLPTYKHAFNVSGSYKVTLIAYNSSGCSKALEKIVTLPAAPAASFLPDKQQDCLQPSLSGCAPFSLQFTNTSSSSSAFSSAWSFGDGGSSTATNPLHTFGKGTFVVTLTIKNTQGCTSTTSTLVTVSDVTPVADFTVDKTNVCTRTDVTFTDQSLNANFWCWDFGDGEVGSGSTIKHQYIRPGTYTVTLTSKNAGCTNSKTKTNLIVVKDPFVDFRIKKDCNDPYTIWFENDTDGQTSVLWEFGDGETTDQYLPDHHTYTALGTYNVTLTAFSTITQCAPKLVVPVLMQDIKADFEIDNPAACKNAPVKFTDKSSPSATQWVWSLGNNVSSINKNTTTAYSAAGLYQVSLTSYNSDGCSDQHTLSVNVLGLEGKFDFGATSNCDDLTVNFRDRSVGTPPINVWSWDFGDGEVGSGANPPHVFHDPGKYTVKLTITNDDGTCSFIKDDAITFNLPEPDFLLTKPVACIKEPVTFVSTSIRAVSLNWDFGDGQTSTASSPQVAYASTGNYDITLNVTDRYGCKQSLTKPAFLSVSKPSAAFDVTERNSVCPPFTSFFKDKSVGKVVNWKWEFGDGKKSTLADPANTFLKPGDYDVKLLVTDELGCKDETTVKNFIHVGGPSGTFTSDAAGIFCTGKTVGFTATTTNALTHRWDFGDGSVIDVPDSSISHSYPKKGNFIIDLVMIDGNGCKVAADQSMKITVSDTSVIKIETLPDCFFSGDDIVLNAQTEGGDDLQWNWQLSGLTAGTDSQLQTTIDESGTYALTLTGTNQNGCTSRVPHVLLVQDRLGFIPNVITPNDDGINDTFEIDKINNGLWDLVLYNRWGGLVHKEPGYQGNWDGGTLDTGVYYFSVQNANCREENYKGPVSIIR